VIHNSSLLMDELAREEDGEVWDTAYIEARGELLVLVGVNFENYCIACHVFCGTRDLRCGSAAGTAPVSPEIDENGNAGALDNLVEEGCINLQRFIKRRQGSFTCAAAAGVGKVVRGEAVLLATALAGSYRRH